MESLDSLLREAEIAHGHLCAGQVLGVRMAMLGCRDWAKMAASFLDLGRAADPVLGLKVIAGGRVVRVVALESSKERARELYPHIDGKNARQMLAYRELPDEELFATEWVSIPLPAREMPGYKSARVACDVCGEGINYDREVVREELCDGGVTSRILCQSCAFPKTRYYQPL